MRVPRYDNKVGLDVPSVPQPSIPQAPQEAFGGGVAQAIEDAGVALGKISSQVSTRLQERQEIEQSAHRERVYTDYQKANTDYLYSTEEESVDNLDGTFHKRPKGIYNWQGDYAAQNALPEYRKRNASLAQSALNSVPDPQERAKLYEQINRFSAAQEEAVTRHASTQWKKAKNDAYEASLKNTIERSAGAQTAADLNVAMADAERTQLEWSKFLGDDDAVAKVNISKAKSDILKQSVVASLQADASGKTGENLLNAFKNQVSETQFNSIKKDLLSESKKLRDLQKENTALTQSDNFMKQVDSLIKGDTLKDSDIALLGANNDLPTGSVDVLMKFNSIPQSDAVDYGELDESVVNSTKAILGATTREHLDVAIMSILGDKGFQDTKEGRQRALILLQVARNMGKEAADSKRMVSESVRKIAQDSYASVLEFQAQRGITTGDATLDFMNRIRSGTPPLDAAQQAMDNESLRQVTGKQKDIDFRNSVLKNIYDRNYSETIGKSVFQYALRSGMDSENASTVANKIINDTKDSRNRVDFLEKFSASLDKNFPNMKFNSDIPSALKNSLRQTQFIDFVSESDDPQILELKKNSPYLFTALATVQEVGAVGATFLNGLLAGLPEELLKQYGMETGDAPTVGGRIGQEIGSLYGFIKGLPGMVAKGTIGKIAAMKPVTTLIDKAGAAGKAAAISSWIGFHTAQSAATLGVMSAVMTPEKGVLDWKARAQQAFGGAETGTAFGILGVISSKKYKALTDVLRMGATSLVTWIPSYKSGDPIEKQAFNFVLGTYFGRHGINFSKIGKLRAEITELSKNPVAAPIVKDAMKVLESMEKESLDRRQAVEKFVYGNMAKGRVEGPEKVRAAIAALNAKDLEPTTAEGKKLMEQIIALENVPLHPAKDAKAELGKILPESAETIGSRVANAIEPGSKKGEEPTGGVAAGLKPKEPKGPGGVAPITKEDIVNSSKEKIPEEHSKNIDDLVSGLNKMQDELGVSLRRANEYVAKGQTPFNSSYRSADKNAEVGGIANSAHTESRAVDIPTKSLQLDQMKVAQAAHNAGFLVEDISKTPNHVHIELPSKNSSLEQSGLMMKFEGKQDSLSEPKKQSPLTVEQKPNNQVEFKVKLGESWKITGEKQPGAKPTFKSMTSDKAIETIKKNLKNVTVTGDGDYVIIRGESGAISLDWLKPITDKLPTASEATSLYQKHFNKYQALEDLAANVKKRGIDLKPGEDPGASADRALSSGAQAKQVLKTGTFSINADGKIINTGEGLEPILREYDAKSTEKDLDVRAKDLQDYLISRRMPDLNRPKPDKPSEMIATSEQLAQAEQKLLELNQKYGPQGIVLLERTAGRIYDFSKRVLRSLVDAGSLSEQQYADIVAQNPHYIPFDRVLPEAVTERSGSGFGAKAPIKSIKGSDLEIEDVLESTIKNTVRIIDAANRNKVFKDVHSLRDIPDIGIKVVGRPESLKPGNNVVEGYIDGKRTYLEVDSNLKDAMSGMDPVSSNIILKMLGRTAGVLKTFTTSLPEFMIRNVLRDQHTAFLQTQIGFKPFIDPIYAVADLMGQRSKADIWIKSGGAYGGLVETSRPALAGLLREIQGRPSMLKNLNIITKAQDLSQLLEQSTRLGVFNAAKRKGLSDVEAARLSRESTVNFNRSGSELQDVKSTVAFLNANIAAFDKNIRSFRDNPKSLTLKSLAAITVPSLLLYLHNRQDPTYFEIPRWQRDLFWTFKVGNTWVRYPKPFGYGQIFGSSVERFMEYMDTSDKTSFNKFTDSLLNSLSPVGTDFSTALLPTAFKPILENKFNWSIFKDRPIVSEWNTKMIPELQFNKYTTETAKALGRIVNVSPSKIENALQGWFGGTGKYALDAGDQWIRMFGGPTRITKPLTLSDVPVVKGLVGRDPTGSQSESVNQFYKFREEITAAHNSYNKFMKLGQTDKALKVKKENPGMTLYSEFNAAADQISEMNTRIDKIVSDQSISDADKRRKIKEIEDDMVKRAKIKNDKLKKLKGDKP